MAGAGKRILVGAGVVIVGGVVALYTTSFGKGVRDLAGSGAIQAAVAKHHDLTYEDKSSDQNLRSFATALKLYQESEGQYPDAGVWMDKILPNMILNNLPRAEADKKFTRPGLPTGGYGYALNDVVAGRYVGDLPKGAVLAYETSQTVRNAHGDPKKDARPGARAVTIEGTLVSL